MAIPISQMWTVSTYVLKKQLQAPSVTRLC